MRLSLDWLSDIVTWTERDPHAIADRLTLSSAEVEGVEMQGALLQNCCVGKILKIAPHPNAGRLSLVNVETDKGELRVVCGGTNLSDGMLVAFAHTGATVRHGSEMMTLAPITIRGEMSNGMLCAAEELDLTDRFPPQKEEGERPIIDLTPLDLTVGQDLRTALGLTDTILDINNTAITNRPDLFSHRGFAQECVALGLAKWKKEPKPAKVSFPKTKSPIHMKLEAKSAVSYYRSCLLSIDSCGTTPEWMQKRLIATGFRPISLPVDITNFVSHEIGMPLHSFDADDISGDIRFRLTSEGESIVTLDDMKRTLPEGALVLSDEQGIFDLMGIMGGLRSSTKEGTRRIYLHAAVVDPIVIRRTSTAIGHRTDASTIYEKGIPQIAAEWGFARAVELFLDLVPGAKILSACESWGTVQTPAAITLHPDRLERFLGTSVPEKKIVQILTDLGCTVKKKGSKKMPELSVQPSAWRTKDLSREEDLIDDVARIAGYDTLVPILPFAPVGIPPRDMRSNAARTILCGQGFIELVPLSLVGPALLQKSGFDPAHCRSLQSPLTEDLSLLQPSSLPGLLEHAERSLMQKSDALCTFRLCTVFDEKSEHRELGLFEANRTKSTLLHDPFLSLKQTLTETLSSLGYTLSVTTAAEPAAWAHPGRHADVWLKGAHDSESRIGTMAEIHPDVRARFDLPERAACALLNWSAVLALVPKRHEQTLGTPAFPAIVYDCTVERTHSDAVGELLGQLQAADPLLESVSVQDLYQDARTDDRYRLTLRFVYRSLERTLTEEEAKKAHETVLSAGKLQPIG